MIYMAGNASAIGFLSRPAISSNRFVFRQGAFPFSVFRYFHTGFPVSYKVIKAFFFEALSTLLFTPLYFAGRS